jgi:hypothetical protein
MVEKTLPRRHQEEMSSNTIHACIIIDDPLLRENYGFLNYRKLLSLMDKHNFFTTIAFIPFNYNRTDNKVAALFQERADRFSLCVHGCDHTRGEFAYKDFHYLDHKVQLATARMIEHEQRTGIPFDRVMVFPQGKFSNAAMKALKKNNYLGAVNTEATPVDGPIVSDFPFFLRFKPEHVMDCVCEPAFIVLHHEYFKNGYDRLTDFVDALNSKQKTIKWDSAGNILRDYVSAKKINNSSPRVQDGRLKGIDLKGYKFYGWKENMKIRMRRYASEFRDNYLSKNDLLLMITKSILKYR